jgi:hypothetical protein
MMSKSHTDNQFRCVICRDDFAIEDVYVTICATLNSATMNNAGCRISSVVTCLSCGEWLDTLTRGIDDE